MVKFLLFCSYDAEEREAQSDGEDDDELNGNESEGDEGKFRYCKNYVIIASTSVSSKSAFLVNNYNYR